MILSVKQKRETSYIKDAEKVIYDTTDEVLFDISDIERAIKLIREFPQVDAITIEVPYKEGGDIDVI